MQLNLNNLVSVHKFASDISNISMYKRSKTAHRKKLVLLTFATLYSFKRNLQYVSEISESNSQSYMHITLQYPR